MKKLLPFLLLLVFTISINAHGGSHSDLPEPTSRPGSLMYKADLLFEKISLALTSKKKSEIKKRTSYAEERLAEAKYSLKNNKSESAIKALKRYKNQIKNIGDLKNLSADNKSQLVLNKALDEHKSVIKSFINSPSANIREKTGQIFNDSIIERKMSQIFEEGSKKTKKLGDLWEQANI